jgi:ATP-binding cassette subfamily C protein LapB
MSKVVAPGDAKRQPEQPDDLLLCLQIVARAHGEAASRDALMSGLPAEGARLSPALFARAAKRAHLSSRVVSCTLDSLNTSLFPVILLLNNERACVLLGFSDDTTQAQIVYPELADAPVWRPLDELARDYSGDAIYARPMLRYDARTPTVRPGRHDHWFWGVIAESRPIYQDVLLAAFLANLFALGMPLFTMNVYDRVVPNQAIETLWVLASGSGADDGQ